MRSCQPDVESFLLKVREAIDKHCCQFIPRKKNLDSMTKCGLIPEDIYDAIYSLDYGNYISGPDEDHDYPFSDPFWKFKTRIENEIFYIKIKIIVGRDNKLKVVSFHIDEN